MTGALSNHSFNCSLAKTRPAHLEISIYLCRGMGGAPSLSPIWSWCGGMGGALSLSAIGGWCGGMGGALSLSAIGGWCGGMGGAPSLSPNVALRGGSAGAGVSSEVRSSTSSLHLCSALKFRLFVVNALGKEKTSSHRINYMKYIIDLKEAKM